MLQKKAFITGPIFMSTRSFQFDTWVFANFNIVKKGSSFLKRLRFVIWAHCVHFFTCSLHTVYCLHVMDQFTNDSLFKQIMFGNQHQLKRNINQHPI